MFGTVVEVARTIGKKESIAVMFGLIVALVISGLVIRADDNASLRQEINLSHTEIKQIDVRENEHFSELLRRLETIQQDVREIRDTKRGR